jgi:transposase-like protein
MADKRRAFTPEYKAEVVELIRTSGRSIGAISLELGLTESAVRRWVQRADVDAGLGAPEELTSSEREELVRLRRENRRLTMEHAILRKAAAFFAKGNV